MLKFQEIKKENGLTLQRSYDMRGIILSRAEIRKNEDKIVYEYGDHGEFIRKWFIPKIGTPKILTD